MQLDPAALNTIVVMHITAPYRLAARVVPHLPPRVGYALCDRLGATVGPRLPAYRHVRRNLRVLLPHASERQRQVAAQRVLAGICKNYYDLFRFPQLPPAELVRTTIATGTANVERALAKGRGLLMVAPHAGNYTIIFAPMLQLFDTEMLLIVEQLPDPEIHELVNGLRHVPRVSIEPLGPNAGRAVLRALRQNQIVLLGGDRAIAENAVTVQFFGRPTPMPSGPAALALRTGAPLLTAFTNRLPDNRSYVHLDPVLQIERSASLQDDVRDVTQKIAYIMQAYIRRDPAQWLVAEDVWPSA